MTAEQLKEVGNWRLSDFDTCECGDYRKDHVDGIGRCRMPDDLTHGFHACLSFRLTKSATEIPAPYTALEPIHD